MEKIIKKAIEGGYSSSEHFLNHLPEYALYQIFCDHRFWQSIGKACGWFYEDGRSVGKYYANDPKRTQRDLWLHTAVHFHELNLTKGFDSAVSWLEELIKKEV